jgi:hypothetical protein
MDFKLAGLPPATQTMNNQVFNLVVIIKVGFGPLLDHLESIIGTVLAYFGPLGPDSIVKVFC